MAMGRDGVSGFFRSIGWRDILCYYFLFDENGGSMAEECPCSRTGF